MPLVSGLVFLRRHVAEPFVAPDTSLATIAHPVSVVVEATGRMHTGHD
jgi:hypothetical protein